MNWTTRLILIALVAFAAALGGTYAGRVLFAPERQSETELHALLHSELELEMRAANAHLAEAMELEHGYGPQVTTAIDHTHKVMGEMQKETLEHLFAMRAVLRPDQAAKFDRSVTRALTPEVR